MVNYTPSESSLTDLVTSEPPSEPDRSVLQSLQLRANLSLASIVPGTPGADSLSPSLPSDPIPVPRRQVPQTEPRRRGPLVPYGVGTPSAVGAIRRSTALPWPLVSLPACYLLPYLLSLRKPRLGTASI